MKLNWPWPRHNWRRTREVLAALRSPGASVFLLGTWLVCLTNRGRLFYLHMHWMAVESSKNAITDQDRSISFTSSTYGPPRCWPASGGILGMLVWPPKPLPALILLAEV